jgi:hypothetical protein
MNYQKAKDDPSKDIWTVKGTGTGPWGLEHCKLYDDDDDDDNNRLMSTIPHQ